MRLLLLNRWESETMARDEAENNRLEMPHRIRTIQYGFPCRLFSVWLLLSNSIYLARYRFFVCWKSVTTFAFFFYSAFYILKILSIRSVCLASIGLGNVSESCHSCNEWNFTLIVWFMIEKKFSWLFLCVFVCDIDNSKWFIWSHLIWQKDGYIYHVHGRISQLLSI